MHPKASAVMAVFPRVESIGPRLKRGRALVIGRQLRGESQLHPSECTRLACGLAARPLTWLGGKDRPRHRW